MAENADRYFTVGEDSMAHKMKGTIGLFISSGENIKVFSVKIDGVEVKQGYAYAGPKFGTINKFANTAFGEKQTVKADCTVS